MNKTQTRAYLVLEDGTVFKGFSMGKKGTAIGEVVFNTCTASYEELFSDPTYYGQIVAQTYPLGANRGVKKNGSQIMANGYIVREWCDMSEGGEASLNDYLLERGIVGICGIDTRRLTRVLRDKGYMKGAVCESLNDFDSLIKEIKKYTVSGAVEAVSTKEIKTYKAENARYSLGVLDCGFPFKTVEDFLKLGCDVTLLPAFTTASEAKKMGFDGIMLSDGPADPDDNPEIIENIKELIKLGIPIIGIGLGHQMLSIATGGKIVKMAQGHRGSNQPVMIDGTENFMVTDQNHGYSVSKDSIDKNTAEITMTNINDGTVEGVRYKQFRGIGVQFTPDGDPDSSTSWIYTDFIKMMGESANEQSV